MRTFHIGGTANLVDSSLDREQLQRHGEDQEPRDGQGLERPAHRHDPHHVGLHHRPVGQGAGGAQDRLRRPPVRRRRRYREARHQARDVGSLHPSDPVGSQRYRRFRGSDRRRFGARADRRNEGHVEPRHRRLARDAEGRRAEARDRHQGQQGQADQGRARRRCPLPALGRCRAFRRSWCRSEGRRRACAYPDVVGEAERHHRRSAARCRTLRGAPSEGSRDPGRDLRHRRVRQGLQEQAAHQHQAGRRDQGNRGIPHSARQEPCRPERRSRRARRLRLRRQPGTARHPCHQGRSRNSPTT